MQVLRDVVNCVHNITSRIVIMDRKRKLETAARLQLQWQRWEITNFEYLMQVYFGGCLLLWHITSLLKGIKSVVLYQP